MRIFASTNASSDFVRHKVKARSQSHVQLADGILVVDILGTGDGHASSFPPRGVRDVFVSVPVTKVAYQWSQGPRRAYQWQLRWWNSSTLLDSGVYGDHLAHPASADDEGVFSSLSPPPQ